MFRNVTGNLDNNQSGIGRVFFSLSARAWRHIRERRPEVSHYEESIKDTLANPEIILNGKQGDRKAVRFFRKTHLGSKYLVVVYREEVGRKDMITAYFTSDLKRVKDEILWKA
jgi:hypothetical protein